MSNKLWEVDPETRSKLQEIQKTNENNRCVDCNAPSPQWASPKLGIFFCLSCSGVHRSLGVHISFVRSITMDSFKINEVEKMSNGGNKPWKDFFDNHKSNKDQGRTFEKCSIQERYDCDAAEEWKDRLTAKVEGKEYVPTEKAVKIPQNKKSDNVTTSSIGNTPTSRSSTPMGRSPTKNTINGDQKSQNEAYFAKVGAENNKRPNNLPPNQGGKYSGFGSDSSSMNRSDDDAGTAPDLQEFQKDPVGALTKGLGWLGSTVSKQANAGYKGWLQPNMQKLSESDFAKQASQAAGNLGHTIQSSTRSAADGLSKFVDGESPSKISEKGGPEGDKKDFWDSFGEKAKQTTGPIGDKKEFWDHFGGEENKIPRSPEKNKSSSIGTSAMKKPDESWGQW